MRRFSPLLFLILIAGCHAPEPVNDTAPVSLNRPADRSAGAFAQTDPWLLTTTDPNAARGNHGIFLGNGALGATFGATGGAGKDSVSFLAGHYDEKETLEPVPNGHDLGLPTPKPGNKYEQALDMKRGVMVTQMGGVTVTSFVSQARPDVLVVHVQGAVPDKAVSPPAAGPIVMAVRETSQQGGGSVSVSLGSRGPSASTTPPTNDWTRFVSVTPRSGGNLRQTRLLSLSYEQELSAHENAWAKLWQDGGDIQIEGDPEAQQLVHKLMFDLLQSTRPGASDSIPPESLSGDFYKGHIFWDAEVWMFPALLAQHPELARSILDYRFAHLLQARAIAKTEACAGADFPWESASSGKEVAPGGFSQGRHVTAGVGWAAWQYYLATQDKAWLKERGWPLLSAVADYWATRAKKDAATGVYHIRNVYGPDEVKGQVDDNTYTNAMARYCLLAAGEAAKIVGQSANTRWADVAKNIALPFDKANRRYMARANDDNRPTKQADGELVIYPAEMPMDSAVANATFDFQAARPITNGPAMTASIHALIAARLGKKEQAEKEFRDSYRPFMRGPFLLFSEKRSLDRCVFTTGAGGVLQAVLYGFGGLDWQHWDETTKRPVCLPPTWKKLTITGIKHAGKRYTLTVTPQGRTLTPE